MSAQLTFACCTLQNSLIRDHQVHVRVVPDFFVFGFGGVRGEKKRKKKKDFFLEKKRRKKMTGTYAPRAMIILEA
ncbi:hypothetical protein, partial [Litorimonas sp.]|uniref:hypothetical protein n=1 Tax=Litorimonas sp. TaxID=1892381 RepID=UPI003A83F5E1